VRGTREASHDFILSWVLTHSTIPMGNCLCSSAVVPSSTPPPLPVPALPPETAQYTHPTSIPLPNVSNPLSFMAPFSQGSRRKPTHTITPYNDGAMASTPSPKPGAVGRARAQSEDTELSRRPHRGGRDCPPPSSGCDVFTLQHPDLQETYLYQSGGTGPMQLTRSVSMGVASLQGACSHSSGRGTSETIQMLGGRLEGRPSLPLSLHRLLSNNIRYAVRRFSTSLYYHRGQI